MMNISKLRIISVVSTLVFAVALFGGLKERQSADLSSRFPKIPVIFHPSYDISFCGLEKLHPLDSKKYGKVFNYLVDELNCRSNRNSGKFKYSRSYNKAQFYTPEIVSDEDLLKVHTPEYIKSLNNSSVIAQITEILPAAYVPNFLLRWSILSPMKYATGGTILAAKLALEIGWAINLSGGYHHAKANGGSGFCIYADIPLAIYKLHEQDPSLKVMIVDLDAHQGNGHEAICGGDPRIAIYDIYNQDIYPRDRVAKQFITFDYPVSSWINDSEYLALLETTLPEAIDKFKPDLIIYNAGTDIYRKDRLGRMFVSEDGIIARDEFVFNIASEKRVSIAMVLSGGYTQEGTGIICKSIKNILKKKGVITETAV